MSVCLRVVDELRSRFAQYMKTGDDSQIPPELELITYAVVRYSSHEHTCAYKLTILSFVAGCQGRRSRRVGSCEADRREAKEPIAGTRCPPGADADGGRGDSQGHLEVHDGGGPGDGPASYGGDAGV